MENDLKHTRKELAGFVQVIKCGEKAQALKDRELLDQANEFISFDSSTYEEALLQELLLRFIDSRGLWCGPDELAADSDNMKAILALKLTCPVISKSLKLKETNELSWRETLELMVVALAEVNTSLHNQLIAEITRKKTVSDIALPCG